MSLIKNIIFDFDGTLVDTAPLIVRTMQETMRMMGLPVMSEEECRATIGLRLEDISDVLWPERQGIGNEYAKNYRYLFDKLKRPIDVSCFPDVREVLDLLHNAGLHMAIASSRNHQSLQEYVEQFGISEYFDMLVGGNDVEHGKPAADPVLKILNACGWTPGETLTIGDAPVDILMGQAAGTHTCAVTYGNGSLNELTAVKPDYIINAFEDLKSVLS